MESRRAEWTERVRRWRRSGLTAREFAESIGVKAATLTHWAWRVGREGRGRGRTEQRPVAVSARFVEVIAAAAGDERFELELGNGRRLRIPTGFEAAALERLLVVVEGER